MLPTATLADLFAHANPSHPAVILPESGASTTYADLARQVESLADRLRTSSLQPGEPVAIVLPNGLEYLVTFLAVTRARLIAAPLNPAYKAEEFRFYLEDTGAKVVIGPPEQHTVHAPAAELGLPIWSVARDARGKVTLDTAETTLGPSCDLEPPRPDDIALFLHTSGTTSRPKGVPLTHGNLMASIGNIARHFQLSPRDTGLLVMPLFHVHGLIGATLP